MNVCTNVHQCFRIGQCSSSELVSAAGLARQCLLALRHCVTGRVRASPASRRRNSGVVEESGSGLLVKGTAWICHLEGWIGRERKREKYKERARERERGRERGRKKVTTRLI